MKHPRTSVGVSLLAALLLVGCSPAVSDEPKESPAPTAEATQAPQGEETPKPAEIGDRPVWATNPVNLGTPVGEQQGESWNVQIFRVGAGPTTSDGIWEMPGTNAPVIPAGTSMTVYNVVFTNTSEVDMILDEAATAAAVTLFHYGVEEFKASLLSFDPEITESFGLSTLPFSSLSLDQAPRFDDRPGLIVKPGESFALATNTWATTGDIEVSAFVNVMDDRGKPDAEASELLTFIMSQK